MNDDFFQADAERVGRIWSKLSTLEIDHLIVEKKGTGNPSYLSWGDAWGLLMQHYPAATFKFHRSDKRYEGDEVFEALDGSAEVRCTVTIENVRREMWLPVMDHKFNAIQDPDAREVSDAKMRCLVKCLAMFGLGHKLYAKAKEDVPDESRQPRERGGRNSRSRPAGGSPRQRQDNRRSSLPEKIDNSTAINLIREASNLDQLEDRYDEQLADAKKRGDEKLIDQLRDVYDARRDELEG